MQPLIPPRHYLLWAVLAFMAGITGAGIQAVDLSCLSGWIIVILGAAFITAATGISRSRLLRFCIPPIFFLLGLLQGEPLQEPHSPDHIYNLVSHRQEATVIGVLAESPEVGREKSRLLIAVEKLILPSQTHKAEGTILITMWGEPPPQLMPGDRLLARAVLDRSRSFRNQGTFDYSSFLAQKGIWVTGWAKTSNNILIMHEIPGSRGGQSLRFLAERIRHRVNSFLDATLEQKSAGFYKAIITGDRSGLDPVLYENFRASGAVHLLAISGMHMGLLAFFFAAVLLWTMKRSTRILLSTPAWKIASALALLPLTAYAFLAGFHTPVLRALVMTTVFILAVISNRQWSILNTIAFAALVILAWSPSSLFDVSFQLSFAAVTVLGATYPRLKGFWETPASGNMKPSLLLKGRTVLISSLTISLIASLGTAPLVLYHFNRVALLSPFSTLLIMPFLCFWALVLGLVGLAFLPLCPSAAALFFKAGAWGLAASERIAALLAAVPFSSLWSPTPNIMEIMAFYGLLAAVFVKQRKHAIILALPAVTLLIISPATTAIARKFQERTTVAFLDVGQGNASVIELQGGRTILIDGGGPKTPKFNIGERVIAPYLWHRRIAGIDDLVINHPHSDHFNGLFFILSRFKPERLWINGGISKNPEYQRLLELAAKTGTTILVPKKNEVLSAAGQSRLVAISDQRHSRGDRGAPPDHNNQSLVLRLEVEGFSFLFPGDIDRETEKNLVDAGLPIDVDVLLSPHHGSQSSNGALFIERASPTYMVISAGPHRPGTFPAPELITRLEQAEIKTFTTARNGSVSFIIENNTLTAAPYLTHTP